MRKIILTLQLWGTAFTVTFYGTLSGGGMSGRVLARCKSGVELYSDGASQEIMYIWDYYVTGTALTKVH